MNISLRIPGLLITVLALQACRTGTGIFGKKTPHEQYADKLAGAGLKETALGRAWFDASDKTLSNPLSITIPYKETGYFAADKPHAIGLRFQAKRGEKLNINVTKRPATGFAIYLELWQAEAGKSPKLVAAADTTLSTIEHEVDDVQAVYVLRLQPELLKGGEYTLSISAGPSLAYPIKASGKNHTQSFWGDARDAGVRKHEGIDMFAPRLTPVVAAADGRVTRVNENNLGGLVVWMRPRDKNYTLYYAHLDKQLVTDGQAVKVGDTLGLIGNTGNAKSTAPHLHFGIYTSGGAVDPFPFINPVVRTPPNITALVDNIGKFVSAETKSVKLYAGLNEPAANLAQHTFMEVEAAAADWYKVRLPDGRQGLVKSADANALSVIRRLTVKQETGVYDMPDSAAARKQILKAGNAVNILAAFNNYYFVRTEADITGWILKMNP
jgi:murein DD-endopeptidase MepM/ murein hydrolase activator NlpD/SH3-like domain-containing protein